MGSSVTRNRQSGIVTHPGGCVKVDEVFSTHTARMRIADPIAHQRNSFERGFS